MAGLRILLDPAKTGPEALTLEENLRKRVVGQDHAVREIVDVYQTFVAGMSSPGRPAGSLLFLGPTGSGKTRTVEAVAEALVGDRGAVVKIDCAEFQHSHEIAKLIGSPPGYLGHRETKAMLSQEALNQHHTEKVKLSFLLFDEIEKASDALWNLLLGILDKAALTLGDNRRVDFSEAMVFLTSNLGAAEMSSLVSPRLGFHATSVDETGMRKLSARISSAGIAAARRTFTPEFINRLDNIVVFKSLGKEELLRIVDIELEMVQQRIQAAAANKTAFLVNVTDTAKEFLLVEGTDSRYGARHLKRAIERRLVQPLSNLMASGQIHRGDCICVSHNAGAAALIFGREQAATRVWEVAGHAA